MVHDICYGRLPPFFLNCENTTYPLDTGVFQFSEITTDIVDCQRYVLEQVQKMWRN
jgi:hypothetical protein